MAEIRVEPKRRSMGWVWGILLVLVLAAIAYFFFNGGLPDGTAATPGAGPSVSMLSQSFTLT
jgi:hypothetical protein